MVTCTSFLRSRGFCLQIKVLSLTSWTGTPSAISLAQGPRRARSNLSRARRVL